MRGGAQRAVVLVGTRSGAGAGFGATVGAGIGAGVGATTGTVVGGLTGVTGGGVWVLGVPAAYTESLTWTWGAAA